MDYETNKQQTQQNILDYKQRVKDLQESLKQQNSQHNELLKKKQLDEEKRIKSKKSGSKFSSFENAINRPPFFSANHVEQVFEENKFIDNEVPALTATQKHQLIEPSRNKNPEHFIYKVDHPNSKLVSDFPTLKAQNMSLKEINRLQQWQATVQQNAQLEIEERNKTLVGSIKKQQIEAIEHKVFNFANSNLRILNPKVSLISEYPLTPRRVRKLIELPRLYEKKVWVPNDNYY